MGSVLALVASVSWACARADEPLVVPTTAPVLTTVRPNLTTTTVEEIVQQRYYVVQPGDTLGLIATRFGITVAALREANGKEDDLIVPDDQLLIPPEPLDGTPAPQLYLVEPGDTLGAIAAAYGVTVDQLREANDITGDLISINQQLIIPR